MREITVNRWWCKSPIHSGPRWLLATEFYREGESPTGLKYYCKTCCRILRRQYKLLPHTLEKRRESDREYETFKRRDGGISPRKIKNPTPKYGIGRFLTESIPLVDPQPFMDWIKENHPVMNDNEQKRLRLIRNGQQKQIELKFVDEIMTRNGCNLDVILLYPPERKVLA